MLKNKVKSIKKKLIDSLNSNHVASQREELLTESEFKAIRLLGDFHNLCVNEIVGKEISGDMQEIIHHVHILQRTIMKQAAARAYPKEFRLLGKKMKK
jgi:hypothetical protein